jgi:hypothetical protein
LFGFHRPNTQGVFLEDLHRASHGADLVLATQRGISLANSPPASRFMTSVILMIG